MISPSDYYSWRGIMPNYYSWEEQDLKVIVQDQNKCKSLFSKWNHYYVGDIVRLVISIERLSPKAPPINHILITEKTPKNENYVARKPVPGKAYFNKTIFAIRGNVLDASGDDLWRLEIHEDEKIEWSRKIFDAGIANKDAMRRDYKMVIIGFILVALFTLAIECYFARFR